MCHVSVGQLRHSKEISRCQMASWDGGGGRSSNDRVESGHVRNTCRHVPEGGHHVSKEVPPGCPPYECRQKAKIFFCFNDASVAYRRANTNVRSRGMHLFMGRADGKLLAQVASMSSCQRAERRALHERTLESLPREIARMAERGRSHPTAERALACSPYCPVRSTFICQTTCSLQPYSYSASSAVRASDAALDKDDGKGGQGRGGRRRSGVGE